MTFLRRSVAVRLLVSASAPAHTSSALAASPPIPAGAVIFLHGSGDTGAGLQRFLGRLPFVKSLENAGVRVEYPSAVPIPYTYFGGQKMSVWFDRQAMDPTSPEQTKSVEASCTQLEEILDRLVTSGVPARRIAIGGFSMGGGIALQTALRSKHAVGGVFAMSSYLCDDAAIFPVLARLEHEGEGPRTTMPRIWMAHGAADTFVRPEWGEATAKRLRGYGLEVSWRSYVHMQHELRQDELDDLDKWLTPLVLPQSNTSGAASPREELRQ